MLSKKVLAITADRALGRRLTAGLAAAGGAVESIESVSALPSGPLEYDLVVLHLPESSTESVIKELGSRLVALDGSIVAVIPTSSLVDMVRLMQATKIGAVLVADTLTAADVAATARRLLFGDIFGIDKELPWGAYIHAVQVGDYQEKSAAITQISEFAQRNGVRRKYREAVEQVLDELLMNALYDAPTDEGGNPRFADVPVRSRISLRLEERATVQYAFDGERFVVAVRDVFGALKPETILRYLHKCLHSAEQIDRKTGGAGLGLYIIANSVTRLMFNLCPSVATEVVCTFDLHAPKIQLKELAVFDAPPGDRTAVAPLPGQEATLPSAPASAPAGRGLTFALGVAVVALLGLIGVVAYPRFAPKGTLVVTTDPPGASVEIDGEPVGATTEGPLAVGGLTGGQKIRLTARLEGFDPRDEIVAPTSGGSTAVRLALKPRPAIVRLETQPPGATVVIDGREAGLAPLVVRDFVPESEHTIVFRKTGYLEQRQTVKAPGPGRDATVVAPLAVAAGFAQVRLETEPPGAAVYQNDQLLAGVVTPALHLVEGGREHTFTFRLPGHAPAVKTVKVDAGAADVPVTAALAKGGMISIVVTRPEAKVTVVGVPGCTDRPAPLEACPVPDGTHKVQIRAPDVEEDLEIRVKGDHVEKTLEYGTIEASTKELVLEVPGKGRVRRAVLPAGTHRVKVIWVKGGTGVERTVRVAADRTVTVGMEE